MDVFSNSNYCWRDCHATHRTLARLIFPTPVASYTLAPIVDVIDLNTGDSVQLWVETFEVEVAENGRDGVALVQHMKPDIILLDMHMPEMDGSTALTKIRAEKWGKDIPVIVLTNLGEEESPKSLRALGISGYIVKADFTPRQVVARVKDALNG